MTDVSRALKISSDGTIVEGNELIKANVAGRASFGPGAQLEVVADSRPDTSPRARRAAPNMEGIVTA